jgi:hypothetical protein
MALPSSGPLSISEIRNEEVNNGGFASTYSLYQLSINAGKASPDAISEFYGYSASISVYINVYVPNYVGCYNYYTFAATSSLHHRYIPTLQSSYRYATDMCYSTLSPLLQQRYTCSM